MADSLKQNFKTSTSTRGAFRYVGLNVLQSKKEIKVDQNSYIVKIQPIYLESDRSKEIDSELSKDEVSKLRSISVNFCGLQAKQDQMWHSKAVK